MGLGLTFNIFFFTVIGDESVSMSGSTSFEDGLSIFTEHVSIIFSVEGLESEDLFDINNLSHSSLLSYASGKNSVNKLSKSSPCVSEIW